MKNLNIGVFGDSFAWSDSEDAWVNLLKKEYDTIQYFAKPGSSLWYSFNLFLKNHNNFNTIIFCYTHYNRFNLMPDNLEIYSGMTHNEEYKKLSVYERLTSYEKDLLERIKKVHIECFNYDYYLWISQKIFDDVNSISKKNNVKLINILPFQTEKQEINIESRHGDCYINIFNVSQLEQKKIKNLSYPDSRPCHLSPKSNYLLSKLVSSSIKHSSENIIDFLKIHDAA